jgi:hypothetical protein
MENELKAMKEEVAVVKMETRKNLGWPRRRKRQRSRRRPSRTSWPDGGRMVARVAPRIFLLRCRCSSLFNYICFVVYIYMDEHCS